MACTRSAFLCRPPSIDHHQPSLAIFRTQNTKPSPSGSVCTGVPTFPPTRERTNAFTTHAILHHPPSAGPPLPSPTAVSYQHLELSPGGSVCEHTGKHPASHSAVPHHPHFPINTSRSAQARQLTCALTSRGFREDGIVRPAGTNGTAGFVRHRVIAVRSVPVPLRVRVCGLGTVRENPTRGYRIEP